MQGKYMFTLAFLLGIYSYAIFFLGILSLLYKPLLVTFTLIYFLIVLCMYCLSSRLVQKLSWNRFRNLFDPIAIKLKKFHLTSLKGKIVIFYVLFFLLIIQILINLIGALGPELAFDALWYHVTLPKLYFLNHKIFHLGGIFYYSDMPKLTEMFYTAALAIQSEILAKLIHFLFGILCIAALYKLSRKYFSPLFSLLSVLIFYTSLVVGWESITAYIDLARTFFEIMALWAWMNWYETKKVKWIYFSALLAGFAITAKLLAIGSLVIFLLLTVLVLIKEKMPFIQIIKTVFLYSFLAVLIPSPWLVFSYIHTGNPVYPFFQAYPVGHSLQLLNPIKFLQDTWMIFTHADDPISPVFIGFLPLIILTFSKMDKKIKYILYYSILAVVAWYVTPRTGGGRFLLPYLPAFSLLSAWCIKYYDKTFLQKVLIMFVVLASITSISYRGIANEKYLPVIFGRETKSHFLSNHLNFSFGDFYDTDGYFSKHIHQKDQVLLIGFHNLYYVDFPFVDYSWSTEKNINNYIAAQHTTLPKKFFNWKKLYENKKTGVILYTKM